MKLALISPVSMLDKYASQSDGIHLVLVGMVLSNPVYTAWYRKRSEAGDTIILDNNAYENGEPAPMEKIVEAAKMVGATTVVAPDYPGRSWRKTWQAYQLFKDKLPEPFKVFGCPQSDPGDITGWTDCFNAMAAEPQRLSHLGMSILACPVAFGHWTRTDDVELNRFAATSHIRYNGLAKDLLEGAGIKIHYLGLGDKHVDLIQHYRDYGDSLDTKGPIKAGLAYRDYENGNLDRGGKEKLDLGKHYEIDQMAGQCIDYNIKVVKGLMA